MADEDAKRDGNSVPTLLGYTAGGETRRVLVNEDGYLLVDTETVAAGISVDRNVAVDEDPAVVIKATAGVLYGWNIINPNTYKVYLKFYNLAAASVVVGTTPIVKTLMIPAGGSVYESATSPQQAFSVAMSMACTQLLADADTTAIATDVYAEIFYI